MTFKDIGFLDSLLYRYFLSQSNSLLTTLYFMFSLIESGPVFFSGPIPLSEERVSFYDPSQGVIVQGTLCAVSFHCSSVVFCWCWSQKSDFKVTAMSFRVVSGFEFVCFLFLKISSVGIFYLYFLLFKNLVEPFTHRSQFYILFWFWKTT